MPGRSPAAREHPFKRPSPTPRIARAAAPTRVDEFFGRRTASGPRPSSPLPIPLTGRGLLRLLPAQRAVHCHRRPGHGNGVLAVHGPVLALERAPRLTAFPTTAFAGKPTRERNRPTGSSHRSVGSVELCSSGEVCNTGQLALTATRHPSNHKGLSLPRGLMIYGCSSRGEDCDYSYPSCRYETPNRKPGYGLPQMKPDGPSLLPALPSVFIAQRTEGAVRWAEAPDHPAYLGQSPARALARVRGSRTASRVALRPIRSLMVSHQMIGLGSSGG